MRFFRPCIIARLLYPDALFRIKTGNRVCCLTFDDGPDPESTPDLLELLGRHKIKAIFFCTGKAASSFPHLMDQINKYGHLSGNHGYDHLNGWKTPLKKYIEDADRASGLTSKKFFRPPYGKLTPGQYRCLRKSYRIVMWDIMPYDFDSGFDPGRSAAVLKKKLRPGSIVVLHDIPGAAAEVVKQFIGYAESEGYSFVLPD